MPEMDWRRHHSRQHDGAPGGPRQGKDEVKHSARLAFRPYGFTQETIDVGSAGEKRGPWEWMTAEICIVRDEIKNFTSQTEIEGSGGPDA